MAKNSKKKSEFVDFDLNSIDFNPVTTIMARKKIDYPVEFPTRSSMDDIARYLDDELYTCLSKLENDRLKVIESRLDPSPWEIEIAYLRREAGIRKTRREIHEEFLRNNSAILPEEEIFMEDDFETDVNVLPA